VPIGILALVVVTRVLQMEHHRRDHRIDWWGAVALIVGLVPLLIIAEQGREWGWGSAGAFACYLVGVAGLVAFVLVERTMREEALLPLRLFGNSVFAVGSAQSFIIGIGMFGGMASIPLYLQIVKGASPTKAGLLILPMVAGIMSASILAGQVTSRTGKYKKFPVIGSALLVIGLALMSRVGADTSLVEIDLYMVIFGAGLGMNMQTVVLAMQNAVPPRDMGVTTAATTFFRQVGGTLGTAVFLSILFSAASTHIKSAYDKAGRTPEFVRAAAAHRDQAAQLGHGGNLNDTSFLKSFDATLAHPYLAGFSEAMDLVFVVGAAVLVVAFILSLFLKEVPLRTQSGLEAARSAAAAEDSTMPDAAGATHDPEQAAPSRPGR
jgi:hypothetical protein